MSHENQDVAGAEAFVSAEGNMCGTAMQGPDALPGSEATSRKKGTRWNLGDLTSPANALAIGSRREVEETKPSGKRLRSWTAAYYL